MNYQFKQLIPFWVKARWHAKQIENEKKRVAFLPLIDENEFTRILKDEIGIQNGDTVFIHSSIDRLNLSFPFYLVLNMLRQAVGEDGTLLFPTYPKLTSYKFLKSGEIFEVKKTPSYTGALNEFARRQRGALRSLHPTKSVTAIGPNAQKLTSTHQDSPYPYDLCSPYYRITEVGGKIVGIGVENKFISFVHCVDDTLKEKFPVKLYHDELFQAQCRNYNGGIVTVPTYAHNMSKMDFDLPTFLKKYTTEDLYRPIKIYGMDFYSANPTLLYDRMLGLAQEGITFYPRKYYKKEWK